MSAQARLGCAKHLGSGTCASQYLGAEEAQDLFVRREQRDPLADGRIADLKLITPHYQHVEGTSFAAPIVASVLLAFSKPIRRLRHSLSEMC